MFEPHRLQSVSGSTASLNCSPELVLLNCPCGILLTLKLKVFYRDGGHLE